MLRYEGFQSSTGCLPSAHKLYGVKSEERVLGVVLETVLFSAPFYKLAAAVLAGAVVWTVACMSRPVYCVITSGSHRDANIKSRRWCCNGVAFCTPRLVAVH